VSALSAPMDFFRKDLQFSGYALYLNSARVFVNI